MGVSARKGSVMKSKRWKGARWGEGGWVRNEGVGCGSGRSGNQSRTQVWPVQKRLSSDSASLYFLFCYSHSSILCAFSSWLTTVYVACNRSFFCPSPFSLFSPFNLVRSFPSHSPNLLLLLFYCLFAVDCQGSPQEEGCHLPQTSRWCSPHRWVCQPWFLYPQEVPLYFSRKHPQSPQAYVLLGLIFLLQNYT